MFNAPSEEVKDTLYTVAELDENKTWTLIATKDDDGCLERYVQNNIRVFNWTN